jgi:hypothetical protein
MAIGFGVKSIIVGECSRCGVVDGSVRILAPDVRHHLHRELPRVNAEFQWWLLILGIVIGGALVYLVMADLRTDENAESELSDEPELTDEPATEDEADPDAGPATEGSGWPAGASVPGDPDVEGDRPERETAVTDLP